MNPVTEVQQQEDDTVTEQIDPNELEKHQKAQQNINENQSEAPGPTAQESSKAQDQEVADTSKDG